MLIMEASDLKQNGAADGPVANGKNVGDERCYRRNALQPPDRHSHRLNCAELKLRAPTQSLPILAGFLCRVKLEVRR